jgi:ABC-2 type transport system permease protein
MTDTADTTNQRWHLWSSRPEDAKAARAAQLATQPMEAAGPQSGFITGTVTSIREVWTYRGLLYLLFRRELKARYKDSTLGLVWSLIRPLALLAVYTVAIGKFLGASKGGQDYPIYVFCGLTIWQLFAEIVSSGTGSILGNGGLVKKIYLPREVFPLSTVGSALFNFAMQLIILVVGTVLVRAVPTGSRLLYAPLAILLLVVWGTAFAFVLGAVNVYLRDVAYLVEIGLMFGMWMSPVVYQWSRVDASLSSHPFLRELFLANPVTEAVLGFQRAFWVRGDGTKGDRGLSNTVDNLGVRMAIVLAVGVVFLWFCQRIFARLQNNFAQEL